MKNRMASQFRYNNRNALKHATPRVRVERDCSRLTDEQLRIIADAPGNADCVRELERRQSGTNMDGLR